MKARDTESLSSAPATSDKSNSTEPTRKPAKRRGREGAAAQAQPARDSPSPGDDTAVFPGDIPAIALFLQSPWSKLPWGSLWAFLGAFLLVAAYMWGLVYQQTKLDLWGYQSFDAGLSVEDMYVQAFLAAVSLLLHPRLPNDVPGLQVVFVIATVPFMVGMISYVLNAERVRALARKTRQLRWKLSRRTGQAVEAALWTAMALFAGATGLYVVLMAVLFVIGPPLLAARADVQKEWEQRLFEKWDRVMWTSHTGEKSLAYVYACNDDECALFDGRDKTFIVPRERLSERENKANLRSAGPL